MNGNDILATVLSGFSAAVTAAIWFKLGKLEGGLGVISSLEKRLEGLEDRFTKWISTGGK